MTLEEIAIHLEDEGVINRSPTGNLFLGMLPDEPDEATALYEYGGRAPQYEQNQAAPVWEYARIQIVSRGPRPPAPAGYKVARQMIRSIYDSLASVTNLNIQTGTDAGGDPVYTFYMAIRPIQEPFDLERDEKQRVLFAFNVEAWKEPS